MHIKTDTKIIDFSSQFTNIIDDVFAKSVNFKILYVERNFMKIFYKVIKNINSNDSINKSLKAIIEDEKFNNYKLRYNILG